MRVQQLYRGFILKPSSVAPGWIIVTGEHNYPVTYAKDVRVAKEIVDRLQEGYTH